MSCEKSAIKCCPAVIAVDDCKKGPSCVVVCNDPFPFNHVPSCCNYGCKDCKIVACWNKPCTKSCNSVLPCCDYSCKDSCKIVACNYPCSNPCNCTPPCFNYGCKDSCKIVACNYPCGNPCNCTPSCFDYGCKPGAFKDVKHDCKGTSPRANTVTGCLTDIKLNAGDSKEAFCKLVCERSTPISCHDQDIKNVSGHDCKRMQPCGNKMIGRFPVIKLDSEGPCCEPTHAFRN